jgi:c-di-AMP phosphodiesterase-like protein
MNQRLTRLREAQMQLFFLVYLLFAVVTIYFCWPLALAELAAGGGMLAYYILTKRAQQQQIARFLDSLNHDIDSAGKDTMMNSPFPMVIFRPDTGEVIWSNDRFLAATGEREHIFDTHITAAVPDFSAQWLMEGLSECPEEYAIGERRYRVFGHLMDAGTGEAADRIATTYWLDVTDLADVRDEFYATRPVVSIVTIDNYDELLSNATDSRRAKVRSGIEREIKRWVGDAGGLLCRYDRDRYLYIFEEQYLDEYRQNRFAILEAVQKISGVQGLSATLSIGIGVGASFQEMFQSATIALDMALSRGGDQAVIRDPEDFEFYGGRTKETERRTKVKSRVTASALAKLINEASQLMVMGHRYADLDVVGAAAGVCAIARTMDVPAYIIREQNPFPASDLADRLGALPEYEGVFLSPAEAQARLDKRTLLVVVDTNRPDQVISADLLNSCRKLVVIDHHRRAVDYIDNATINYHEPYASSAAELTTELLQYIIEPTDLLRGEAEALLAGIVLDTKNFSLRTSGRTFEAAAFLRRCGGDTGEVRKLFQNNLAETVSKFRIISAAQLCHDNVAVAPVEVAVPRVIAAQAADSLLNVAGVGTSFVLFPENGGVTISGRSVSDVNVQTILETLGGGGNGAAAGAQVPEAAVPEVHERLMAAIDRYFADREQVKAAEPN